MGSRVLVVGSGGREHALAWRLARDSAVDAVLVAPGNGGTAGGKISNTPSGTPQQFAALARERGVGLTVIGGEAPLAAGIADEFAEQGLALLGPTRAAARLESSKSYAKKFMRRHGIPTADAEAFADLQPAVDHLARMQPPYVIKADGLAAGKGVSIVHDRKEAERTVAAMLAGRFGDASRTILLEQYLTGREATLIALCYGESIRLLGTSQDYKRIGDGDTGPNTGGMGAASPAPFAAGLDAARLADRTIAPAIEGLRAEGESYCGFLYAGLMIGSDGEVNVLEYNCRLGDPEAQVLLPLWDGSMHDACMEAVSGRQESGPLPWRDGCVAGVVLASPGYPGEPATGIALDVPACDPEECIVFHAATEHGPGGSLRTCGGRVLCATGLGEDLASARGRAYGMASRIGFPGAQMRSDIAAC